MLEKELLRKLREETIYSAKGHFKACDLRRKLVTYTIWSYVALNILVVWGVSPSVDKVKGAFRCILCFRVYGRKVQYDLRTGLFHRLITLYLVLNILTI